MERRFRTIFFSDVHLGTRGCQAELLLDFLRSVRAERIYLVGDIFDGWKLKRSWYWPQSHNDVVQKLLRQARKGVEMIYVPGNHDELLRDYVEFHFGGIEVRRDTVHETADGKRLLVTHGDAFDGILQHARWLTALGDGAYYVAMLLNTGFNWLRRRLGFGYWPLASYLKGKVTRAMKYVEVFERALAAEARRRRVDGVVCGHIHHPGLRYIDGVLYANTGDWVESCTALVEHPDGRLEMLRWTEAQPLALVADARAAA